MKHRTNEGAGRLISSGIFSILRHENRLFVKCSTAYRLLNQCVKLAYGQRFLRFARNLRPHCFGEGNRVEHFSDFWRFCSTFGAARVDFEVSGRQKRSSSSVFCLLLGPRPLNLDQPVDKKEAFLPFFVYFQILAP